MYFANLDDNNIVIRVIVADQEFIGTQSGTWIQTDINGISPKNYAGIGYTWNSSLNGFIAPQPYPSWILNNTTCCWEAPTSMPTTGRLYKWDEITKTWILST